MKRIATLLQQCHTCPWQPCGALSLTCCCECPSRTAPASWLRGIHNPTRHCIAPSPNAPTAAAASLLHLHRPRVRPALFHLEVKPKVRPAKACAGWHFPGGRSACCSGVIESLGGPACQWQRQQPAHGAGQAMFSFCLLMPLVACIPPSAHPLPHPAPPACQPAALEGRLQNHGGGAAGAQI